MATNTDDRCSTCRHYWVDGECRRYPPSPGTWKPTREGEQAWIDRSWPVVEPDDWCGEHSPAPLSGVE